MDVIESETSRFTEEERACALARFYLLRPFLEEGVSLQQIADQHQLSLRTARRWVRCYRHAGLAGLCRNARADKHKRRMPHAIKEVIEGLALQKPRLSAAAIHRKASAIAANLGQDIPSYRSVHRLIVALDPALMTLAHGGTREYSEAFDLLHRVESSGPNAVWQADHTELDIWVLDEKRCPRKPWLSIVLDDYSRAVAGYFLSFNAPSALQTALALRQAIWRKGQAGWQICGIPQVLYTDHGSDFTSRHIEQVVADLKIRLVFSAVGKPRGRGKIERFFSTVNQVFLSRLPGYSPAGAKQAAKLTLPQLASAFETYVIKEYHETKHSTTGEQPQRRWMAGGFLPQMPSSLEQLDLLLLTVPRTRRVQQDGIHFMRMRYISPILAAYVGERVLLRYDPRDMAEVRLFHHDRFLCRAICQDLAGESVSLREIVKARDSRRRQLRQTLNERRRAVESLLEARRWTIPEEEVQQPPEPVRTPQTKAPTLKRYRDD